MGKSLVEESMEGGARVLVLDEGEPREVELAGQDASAIRRRYKTQLSLSPAERPGFYILSAPEHVGRVSLPSGAFLVVRPKVPLTQLFLMLAEAVELADFHPPPTRLGPDDEIFLLVLHLFLAQVEGLVAAGLYRTHQVGEADLPMVRGRIQLAPSLRRYGGLRHRHVCSFASFSADTPENRVIAAALRCLPALLRRESERDLQARIRALLRHFSEVAGVTPAHALSLLPLISFHRLNSAYPPVLAIARLVLNHLTLVEQSGGFPLASFLIDMPRLFERYVASSLRRLLPPLGLRAVAQRSDYLDEQRRVSVRPDLLLFAGSSRQPALVVDTKYKRLRGLHSDDMSADLYQLNAYMDLYRLRNGALVYPRFAEDAAAHLQMRGSGRLLHLVTLDLAGESGADLREATGGLAGRLAELAEARHESRLG